MNKKLIRLSESDLHRIVKESVNKVLNEMNTQQSYDIDTDEVRKMARKLYKPHGNISSLFPKVKGELTRKGDRPTRQMSPEEVERLENLTNKWKQYNS